MDVVQLFVKPFGEETVRGKKRLLRQYGKKSGVYLIKENGIIVYVGMSNHCVVKALYRHFYKWRDCYRGMGREYRTTYFDMLGINTYECTIITTAKEQTNELERSLIISLNPRDNRYKYEAYFERLVEDAVNKQGLTLYDNTNPFTDDKEFENEF